MSDPSRRTLPGIALGAPWLLFAAVAVLGPMVILALYSVWTPLFFEVEEVFTLGNYGDLLEGTLYLNVLGRTLGFAAISAIICTGFGFVMAYAITFRMPRRGTALLVLVAATLLASYLVRVYAWGTILGTNGLINRGLTGLGIIDSPLTFLFYGRFAIVLTLVYVYLPLAVLIIYGGLQTIDPRSLEASRDMGAGRWTTVLRIALPQARTAVVSAFALTFILSATDYVTPTLVGGANAQMVGSVIRDQFGGAANLPRGAALAFVTMAAVVLVIALVAVGSQLLARLAATARPMRRRARRARLGAGLARRSLSRPVTYACVGFLLAPLLVVAVFSLNSGRIPGLPMRGISFRWYGDIVSQPGFAGALGNSVQVAAIAVAGGMLLGVPVAFALARRRLPGRSVLSAATYAPVAVPGVVLGVAVLVAATYVDLRLGAGIASAVHIALVVPYVVLVVRARLTDVDPFLGEAARDLGASPRRVLSTVTVPLTAPSLLVAAILAAAVSIDEILVSSFVVGTDPTLPVWIFGQLRTGLTPGINALAVMILVSVLVPVALIVWWMRRTTSGGWLRTRGSA